MFKRSSQRFLSLAVALALSATTAFSQEKPAEQPKSLSLDSLMVEPPKAPEEFKIDETLLTPPENATVDELFAFVEELQGKLPQPKSQDELYQVVDAFSKTCLTVADKLFSMNLDAEQRQRAVQLKVVSLTTRANIDQDAADELDKFVDDNLKAAQTDEELVKAYQLKLQVLAAAQEDSLEKINALADEMFALDKEELQVFALEVKAQSFLTNTQRTGELDQSVLKFVESVIADAKRADSVKEKALEIKLVALVIASELEKEKDPEKQNKSYAEDAEKLFETLFDGDYSVNLRKMVYQLRVQTLLDPNTTDEKAAEKLEALVVKLAKEEDSELYALGVAVKGQLLLNAAQKDKANVAQLAAYADDVYAQAKEKKELLAQAIGLKIQSFRLKEDSEGLLKFIDAELAKNPNEELMPKLRQVKVSVVTEQIEKNPQSFNKHAAFIEELNKDKANVDQVSNLYIARFVGSLANVAKSADASMTAFNAAISQFKQDLLVCPNCVAGLLMARQSVVEIGEKNKKEDLFNETFKDIVEFCMVADNDELNMLAQQLESYQQQMDQMMKQQQAQLESSAKAKDDDLKPAQEAKGQGAEKK